MVRIHLVNFSVQFTTWLWLESSRGLICTVVICIGFIDIVALVGCIRFIHLLFRHLLSALLVMFSNPPVKLSFDAFSALLIIDCQHRHQLFLQWRSKILIWCNYQLIFAYVNSKTNLFEEIQVSSFHTITDYIYVHHYHSFMLYFSSFNVLTLHISFTTNYDQWSCLKYFYNISNFT